MLVNIRLEENHVDSLLGYTEPPAQKSATGRDYEMIFDSWKGVSNGPRREPGKRSTGHDPPLTAPPPFPPLPRLAAAAKRTPPMLWPPLAPPPPTWTRTPPCRTHRHGVLGCSQTSPLAAVPATHGRWQAYKIWEQGDAGSPGMTNAYHWVSTGYREGAGGISCCCWSAHSTHRQSLHSLYGMNGACINLKTLGLS